MRIALKIDIPSQRAALKAVPPLIEILRRHRASASFACAATHLRTMNTIRDAGFEVGLRGAEPMSAWARITHNSKSQSDWYADHMTRNHESYRQSLGNAPQLHAAAHWHICPQGLRLTQRLGFAYASDTRGRHPFIPVWNGEIVRCPQFPTTLPTLDELANSTHPDLSAPRERLLALTANAAPLHLFSLRASPDIAKHPEHIEDLLTGWREQGYAITSIQALAANLDMDKLPRHEIIVGKVPGRYVDLLLQGEEFLSDRRHPS